VSQGRKLHDSRLGSHEYFVVLVTPLWTDGMRLSRVALVLPRVPCV
jgi:hypothetical protein